MSQTEAVIPSTDLNPSSNGWVLSQAVNDAAMKVVATAEAHKAFVRAYNSSQSGLAFFRNLLAKAGIDFGSKTEEAALLVRSRALAATKSDIDSEEASSQK